VLDTTRLVDLLLVLLFEGRKALPKSGAMPVGGPSGHMAGLRRLDSAGERSHRQLIDCIRSKDTDALIDAIDNGSEFQLNIYTLSFITIFQVHLDLQLSFIHIFNLYSTDIRV